MEKMDKDPKGLRTLPTIFDFYTEVHRAVPCHLFVPLPGPIPSRMHPVHLQCYCPQLSGNAGARLWATTCLLGARVIMALILRRATSLV